MTKLERLIAELCPDGVEYVLLGELEDIGSIKLGRGNIISKKDLADYPGDYPVYSSSAVGDGEFGRYGKYMFDDERLSWSIDGGGRFFYRSEKNYSVTNVCGWLKVLDRSVVIIKYLYHVLSNQWVSNLISRSTTCIRTSCHIFIKTVMIMNIQRLVKGAKSFLHTLFSTFSQRVPLKRR